MPAEGLHLLHQSGVTCLANTGSSTAACRWPVLSHSSKCTSVQFGKLLGRVEVWDLKTVVLLMRVEVKSSTLQLRWIKRRSQVQVSAKLPAAPAPLSMGSSTDIHASSSS
jgi:hypothetical protein